MKSQNDVPNGTVLMLGIRFEREEDLDASRGRRQPKVFTYAMLKAGGLWYVTGAGRVPVAAGWGAIERWLAKDGKVVEWVKMATQWADVVPNAPAVEAPPPAIVEVDDLDLVQRQDFDLRGDW